MLDCGVAPAPVRRPPASRRGERRPSGAGVARRAAARLHEARLAELGEGTVGERPPARVDAADLALGRELACDRPAVARLLAEEAERGPLG